MCSQLFPSQTGRPLGMKDVSPVLADAGLLLLSPAVSSCPHGFPHPLSNTLVVGDIEGLGDPLLRVPVCQSVTAEPLLCAPHVSLAQNQLLGSTHLR